MDEDLKHLLNEKNIERIKESPEINIIPGNKNRNSVSTLKKVISIGRMSPVVKMLKMRFR